MEDDNNTASKLIINDETKLILKKLKIVSEEQERGMYLCDKEHSKLLLDYITNLQHTKEYLGEVLHEQDLELQDYKSRIKKAVEYINNNTCKSSVIDYRYMNISDEEIDNLLNILNGRSDE